MSSIPTPKEEARYQARVGMFIRRGMEEREAADLAERCFFRDRDGDDRRGCVECVNFQQRGAWCRNGRPLIEPAILHRCPEFKQEALGA